MIGMTREFEFIRLYQRLIKFLHQLISVCKMFTISNACMTSDSAEKDLDSSGVAGSEPNGPPCKSKLSQRVVLKGFVALKLMVPIHLTAEIWFKSEKLSQTFRVSESPSPLSLSLSLSLSPRLFFPLSFSLPRLAPLGFPGAKGRTPAFHLSDVSSSKPSLEELGKFKCLEAKCREKPWKVRARTYRTKSPSRSEALRFMDSAKSPSTKIDGSLVNFRRRLSNRHGRPRRRMLTMDIRRTPIGLWARLRDSHKSGPQSGWSLAWTLAQRNDWSGKSWPGYDIVPRPIG